VALTFDIEHPDRPHWRPKTTDRLLDNLAAAGVRGTFFIQGRWAKANPAIARRIADGGHLVGNHSFFHASMPLLSDRGLEEDVTRAAAAIQSATGVDPHPWLRFPFGHGVDDPRVMAAIERLGYRHVGWDADPRDWDPPSTAQHIESEIVRVAMSRATCVALLHGWPSGTAPAVAALIKGLGARGVEFVTVDQLADSERPVGITAESETPL
jgi:peptidoglycan/xylan/chitin deacetylase (PgdA/CDA1 family)